VDELTPETISRAVAGDRDSVHDVLAAADRSIRRYARQRLRTYPAGEELAQDAAQEALLALHRALPHYVATSAPFAAWVAAFARNKVADAQRRHARSSFHLVAELPEQTDLNDREVPGPEEQYLAREDQREYEARFAALRSIMAAMPPRIAKVMLLRSAGASVSEVAAELGLTANAVRVAHHRGMKRLHELAHGDG